MKYKFVFESFDEFVKANYQELNEKEKDPGKEMSPAVALELLNKVQEYNIQLLENYIDEYPSGKRKENYEKCLEYMKEGQGAKAMLCSFLGGNSMTYDLANGIEKVFGLKLTKEERNSRKLYEPKVKELIESLDTMSDQDAADKAEMLLKDRKTAPKIKTPIRRVALWDLLPDADKQKAADEFSKLAMKRGYETDAPLLIVMKKSFKKYKKDDRYRMTSPGFNISTEIDTETKPANPPKEKKTFLISEENESELFKPNATGANGEEDFQGASYKEMVDNLGSIFERYLAGEITRLKKIKILTSADRYRNTGSAESLSWGQLSYARALTMARVIEGLAKSAGLDDDIIAQLPKIIEIYAKGDNGDGTSGPNPPEGIKFGYYVKDGNGVKFVDGEDRKTVTMIAVDDEGTPTADSAEGAKTKSMDPEANKGDYNKFRYNNIEVEYEAIDPKKDPGGSEESITNLLFPVKLMIPARYSTKRIRIPVPVLTKSYSSQGSGGKSGATSCPDFTERISTSFGFSFRPVTVAKWKSDMTKDLF
jgi:hypothetical protein